jgi:hypothetical protein
MHGSTPHFLLAGAKTVILLSTEFGSFNENNRSEKQMDSSQLQRCQQQQKCFQHQQTARAGTLATVEGPTEVRWEITF